MNFYMVHNAGQWYTTQIGGAQRSPTHKVVHNIGPTNPDRPTDRLTDRRRCIRAHHAWAQVGSKNQYICIKSDLIRIN